MYKTVNNKFSRIIISFAMALFAVIFLPWGMQTASADIIYFDVTGGQLVFDSATGTIIGYTGNPTDVEIPSTIDDIKVTGIGDRAFESCGSLTSVTMPDGNPDGIKSIGFCRV